MNRQDFRCRHAGFTLIELLISITLGFVVIGAILVMHQTGSAATRMATAQGQMNEDAQMALAVLTHELRIAGFNPTRTTLGAKNDLRQGGWTIFGCDNTFTDNATTPIQNPPTVLVSGLICTAGSGNSAIALVSEGDDYTGKKTSGAPQKPMDCIGNGVTADGTASLAGGSYYTMQARIYVKNNALMCSGSGDLTQEQALAENITALSIRYAVKDAAGQVLGYQTANQINTSTDPALAALSSLARWDRVVAAQICIVVASENAVLGDIRDQVDTTVNPSYLDCNDTQTDITDGRLRRAYRTTVLLRNHGVGYTDG